MQPSFENILVAVDGSPQSNTALDMAVFLSKHLNLKVKVIHVVSPEVILPDAHILPREGDNYTPVNQATMQMPRFLKMPTPREYVLPENVVTEATNWLLERGRTILNDATLAFKLEGIPTEQELAQATDPAEKILEAAEAGKHGLIVAGNSGGEEADEMDLHLGSVAKALALGAKTSVLIVRRMANVKSILVAIDGSPVSEEIISRAVLLAKNLNAKLTVLHVQESFTLRSEPSLKEFGKQILDQAAEKVKGVEFSKLLKNGDPAKVIVETANEQKNDLIVMGKGRRGILRNVMLGKVSDHVVHYANVPVLLASIP